MLRRIFGPKLEETAGSGEDFMMSKLDHLESLGIDASIVLK
jgi:hypothetical protein